MTVIATNLILIRIISFKYGYVKYVLIRLNKLFKVIVDGIFVATQVNYILNGESVKCMVLHIKLYFLSKFNIHILRHIVVTFTSVIALSQILNCHATTIDAGVISNALTKARNSLMPQQFTEPNISSNCGQSKVSNNLEGILLGMTIQEATDILRCMGYSIHIESQSKHKNTFSNHDFHEVKARLGGRALTLYFKPEQSGVLRISFSHSFDKDKMPKESDLIDNLRNRFKAEPWWRYEVDPDALPPGEEPKMIVKGLYAGNLKIDVTKTSLSYQEAKNSLAGLCDSYVNNWRGGDRQNDSPICGPVVIYHLQHLKDGRVTSLSIIVDDPFKYVVINKDESR